jgi:hypothetical protein
LSGAHEKIAGYFNFAGFASCTAISALLISKKNHVSIQRNRPVKSLSLGSQTNILWCLLLERDNTKKYYHVPWYSSTCVWWYLVDSFSPHPSMQNSLIFGMGEMNDIIAG